MPESEFKKAMRTVGVQLAAFEVAFVALLTSAATTQPAFARKIAQTIEGLRHEADFQQRIEATEVSAKLDRYLSLIEQVLAAKPQ